MPQMGMSEVSRKMLIVKTPSMKMPAMSMNMPAMKMSATYDHVVPFLFFSHF